MNTLKSIAIGFGLALFAMTTTSLSQTSQPTKMETLDFGNFSVSLTVKDIKASKAFYEKLDFKEVGGNIKQNWLVLQNGSTTIGLFQGMFDKNILTFNPGWNSDKETLKDFMDVRKLQKTLQERGLEFATEVEEGTTGPASFVLTDPDGNPILVDQHVKSPKGNSKR